MSKVKTATAGLISRITRMELDNIYNMDCLEGMKQIPDGTIDAVICDLPYGIMKGAWKGIEGRTEQQHAWTK